MRRLLVVAAAVVVVAASCIDPVDPLPLDIGLDASRTSAATGDTINFLVTTQGTSLLGVEIDFADGSTDSFTTSGARTAHITFRHAFSVTGSFLVQATVTDVQAGTKSASISVNVN